MLRIVRSKFAWPASWGRTFVVTLVFVTLASGLFWLDFFRSYRADMTVLVVSRTGASVVARDVAGNMAALTRTLAFYERVLAENDLIDDAFDGSAPDKRKALWNDAVSVKLEKGGSTISVRAIGDTPEQAKRLGRQTAQTMFVVAGLYYNVKTDVDMRVIDGPIVARTLENPFLFFLTSIFAGISVTAIFFLILNMVSGFTGFIGGRKQAADSPERDAPAETTYPEFSIGEAVPWIDPKKFIPAKPSTLSFGKRAHAPDNLPIASDGMDLPVADEASLPFEFEARPEDIEASFVETPEEPVRPQTSMPDVAAPVQGEPTAEEYKRRLNELLAGK
ncbi:MAG: hypothetical protein WAW00_00640 [Candidatus Moraniibacteriota bacterium]